MVLALEQLESVSFLLFIRINFLLLLRCFFRLIHNLRFFLCFRLLLLLWFLFLCFCCSGLVAGCSCQFSSFFTSGCACGFSSFGFSSTFVLVSLSVRLAYFALVQLVFLRLFFRFRFIFFSSCFATSSCFGSTFSQALQLPLHIRQVAQVKALKK